MPGIYHGGGTWTCPPSPAQQTDGSSLRPFVSHGPNCPVQTGGTACTCNYEQTGESSTPPSSEPSMTWYLGSMNDGLFIINTPPRPSTDDVWFDRPDGPTLVLNVVALSEERAQAIVDAHNFEVEAAYKKGRDDEARCHRPPTDAELLQAGLGKEERAVAYELDRILRSLSREKRAKLLSDLTKEFE